jgi:hypothetical protein
MSTPSIDLMLSMLLCSPAKMNSAVGAANLCVCRRVEVTKAKTLDLVVEKALHAVLDGLLNLASAQDAQATLRGQQQQRRRHRPGLAAASPAHDGDVPQRAVKEDIRPCW